MKFLSAFTLLLAFTDISRTMAFQSPRWGFNHPSGPFLQGNQALTLLTSSIVGVDEASVNNRHSSSDWLHNVRSLPRSSVLREIRNPVACAAAWSTLVSIVHYLLSHSAQSSLQSIARSMCIPHTAHSFLVSSLGLLLVFRTNSAYQRFNEGRKIWENILSVSRNLSRTIQLYGKEIGTKRKERIINMIAAFPYLLRHHIRPGCLCETKEVDDINRLLLHERPRNIIDARYEGDSVAGGITKPGPNQDERLCWVDRRNLPWSLLESKSLSKVARAANRPLWVCDRMGSEVMKIPYGPNFTSRERLSMLSQIDKLTNAIGQCERIHQTAVPLNYARHALRSLTLWLFTLPFCLVKDLGLLAGPVNAIIAWLMFGVYQIGYSIEDPFQGSLRLSVLCEAIRKDVIETRESAYDLDHDDDWEDDNEIFNMRMIGSLPKQSELPSLTLHEQPPAAESLLFPTRLIRRKSGHWDVVAAER